MHSQPRQSSFRAALAAACLIAAIAQAAPQSDLPPGEENAAANQTALAIAGVAAMAPAAASVAPQPAEAGPAVAPAAAGAAEPARQAGRPMTAEQRQQLIMLLIMRQTSRNPLGTLH